MSLLCSQVEEKIKQTHRKYLLQEQLKIIKKVHQTNLSSLCLTDPKSFRRNTWTLKNSGGLQQSTVSVLLRHVLQANSLNPAQLTPKAPFPPRFNLDRPVFYYKQCYLTRMSSEYSRRMQRGCSRCVKMWLIKYSVFFVIRSWVWKRRTKMLLRRSFVKGSKIGRSLSI